LLLALNALSELRNRDENLKAEDDPICEMNQASKLVYGLSQFDCLTALVRGT